MPDPVDRLTEHLRLGEGFQLAVVTTETVEAADRIIGGLSRTLTMTGAAPVWVARVRPTGASADARTDSIVEALQAASSARAVVLDLTGVGTDEAWAEVFRRLNARRNGLMRLVDRPLILLAPPPVERLFASEAPDFWSVRGLRVGAADPGGGAGRTADEGAVDLPGLARLCRRLYPDPARALPLFESIGFPPGDVPLTDRADFWEALVAARRWGAIPCGVATLVRALHRAFPADEGVAREHGRLPRRVRVTSEWVRASSSEAGWSAETFVGRAALEPILAAVRDPAVRVISLRGPVGSGKDHLLTQALSTGPSEGPLLVRVSETYNALQDAARGLGRALKLRGDIVGPPLEDLGRHGRVLPEHAHAVPEPLRAKLARPPLEAADASAIATWLHSEVPRINL